MTHLRFPSLMQFDDVFDRETYEGIKTPRTIHYRAKIKLHGTNAGIRIRPDGTTAIQSKTQDLSPEVDPHGMVDWFAPQREIWVQAACEETLVFYGEWAGPRIGKGDAIQMTDKVRFYIFALGLGEAPHPRDPKLTTSQWMITDPDVIAAFIPEGVSDDKVRVLPYELAPLDMDFADLDALNAALDDLNDAIERVAVSCPYVSRTFGIEKNGEGYVLVQHADEPGQLSFEEYSNTTYKAKTEKHRVKKQKKPAAPREPLPETATAFVDTFCTPARVSQAIDEVCGGTPDKKMTGKVIAWMVADIEKEGGPEIEALDAAGTPFARLKGPIADATRTIFMRRMEQEAA